MKDGVLCPEHGRLCGFRGDESELCPWCHGTWSHIVNTGYHSCESPTVMQHHLERVGQAVQMRREAAINLSSGTNTPGAGVS